MVEKVFGLVGSPSAQSVREAILQWHWAEAHPFLYTIIKIGTPSVWAIVLYVGFRIISKVFQNTPRR